MAANSTCFLKFVGHVFLVELWGQERNRNRVCGHGQDKTASSERTRMRLIYVIRPPPGGDRPNGRPVYHGPSVRPVLKGLLAKTANEIETGRGQITSIFLIRYPVS